jgi:type IV fimbrial biogenesis protein FimT
VLNALAATLYPAPAPHRFGAPGFTLVEMMIVVTIIAIATILGIPSYRAWIQNTQIYNAAESAQNGLQKAKALAVSMNTNIEFVLVTTSPPSWRIQLPGNALACPLASGTALTTLLECSATEGNKNVSSTTLPSGANTLTFNSLGGVVTPNASPNVYGSAAPLTQISFTSANSTVSGLHPLQVNIGVGGNSRMCDPDPTIPATNPRKC